MARASRFQQLDTQLRESAASHLAPKAMSIPRFRVPQAGTVDMLLSPKAGLTLIIAQRSDHLATYKHMVGELIGNLVHLHKLKAQDIAPLLNKVNEAAGTEIDALKVSKRIAEDLKEGRVTVAIVTEKPAVPQVEQQLAASFKPVLGLLQSWVVTPFKRKKYCAALKALAVDVEQDPPAVTPLFGKPKA